MILTLRGDAKAGYEETMPGHGLEGLVQVRDLKPTQIDVFVYHMDAEKARGIRSTLDELVGFLNSRPTPGIPGP